MGSKILLLFCLSLALIANDLGTVTVTTATKTEKNIDGVSATIIVIDKEDIEKTGAATIRGVLAKTPSINLQFGRFPHPSSKSKASISIRGTGANGTLFLIDGRRMSAETESPYELDRIPTSMIERIEIVKGSMSTLYGADAIGGVINIITKKPTSKQTTAFDMRYGSNTSGDGETTNFNFINMGTYKKIRHKLFGSYNNSNPYSKSKNYTQSVVNPMTGAVIGMSPQNNVSGNENITYKDDSKTYNIGGMLEIDLTNDIILGLDVNYLDEKREGQYLGNAKYSGGGLVKNTPINSKDNNSRVDASTYLDYNITPDLNLNFIYYYSYYKKRNETDPINFSGPTNKKFSANVTIDTFDLESTYSLNDKNLLTGGLEYRKEKRESSAINPNPSSTDFITKEVTYKSVFIQDEIEFMPTLNGTFGARYDDISNAKDKTTFQAGIVKNFSKSTSVRLNYAQGYRPPDIAELYVVSPLYKDGKRYGAEVVNTMKSSSYDLKPEESDTYEIALSNNYETISSEIILFKTIIKNKIELVPYGSGAGKYYTSENIDKVNINGIEGNFNYNPIDILSFDLDLTYLKSKDKSTNKELTFTPNLSAVLGTNIEFTNALSTYITVRYVGEQYLNTQNTKKSNDYTIVDLNLKYNINPKLQIYGGLDNVFSEDVEEVLGSNLGTYVYSGLKYNF